ncbi:MAG: zinc ribbon domain-containing protein [Gallionellaceae bacterium]|nr:zinc ribbon domain-containing protein [Gallionellaceae bacterium]
MSCNHINPPGYHFCGKCGEALEVDRCRCGFAAAAGDIFCGRCGASLVANMGGISKAATDTGQRLDLELMAQQAAQEKQFIETTHKARVTQDDIRKLLVTRKRRF